MSRLGVYVADGFTDDCEELIHRCSKKKPLTYHTFCSIWKSMNFASMYQSRTTSAELAELSEEVLLVAKRYMLADTNNFEETIAGLFLVYALLNLQPFPNFAALRITPDDVPMIRYIEDCARKEKRYDALYILGAMMIKGPCQFHAAEREYGMETPFTKNFEGLDEYNSSGRPKGVFMRKNEEVEILEELKNLTRRYEEAKAAITDENGGEDRNLNYVEPNFAEEMESSLKKVIMGLNDVENDNNEDMLEQQMSTERHETVQAIKNRALKNAVTSMGHLTGIKERAGPSRSAIQSRDKLKKRVTPIVKTKIKTSSPKKPLTTSPRRRQNVIKSKKRLKHKIEINSSESDGDDLELPGFNGYDISDGESEADINETRFDQDPKEKRYENDLNEIDTTEDDDALVQLEKEINIEIDTLPVLIRNSNNKNIEIEFIDNYKKENVASTSKKGEVKKDLQSKLAELSDISIVKNTPEFETPEMDFVFKRPGPGRCYNSKAKKLISKNGSEQVKTMGFKQMPNVGEAKKT